MPQIIPIHDPGDPRLADYMAVKDRQLAAEFQQAPGPATGPATGPSTGPATGPATGSATGPATGPEHSSAPWGKFMAEGELVFRRHARSVFPVLSVLTTPARLATISAELALLPQRTPVYVIEQRAMDAVAGFPIHRGLLAIGARLHPGGVGGVLSRVAPGRPLVVLHEVVNNDNTGAMFRNAAAFGAAGVLLSAGSADPLYRKSLRVSMGHALAVPWARYQRLAEVAGVLRAAGITTLAMTPRGGPAGAPPPRPLREVAALLRSAPRPAASNSSPSPSPSPGPTPGGHGVAIVLGAEGPGLGESDMGLLDLRVSIPMAEGPEMAPGESEEVDSLNVATAGAVALYEFARESGG